MTFLLDWELTMKCNLDCSYCSPGLYGGHDNSAKHPTVEDCINTIDFMFEYVDLYMQVKPKGIKYVVLNIYGGEALHHPYITDIIQECRDRYSKIYQDRWNLTITTTTNAIVSAKKLKAIIPLIDEFTCSYHSEASPKQKQQFKKNILEISSNSKQVKCVIMMHAQPDLFRDSSEMVNWCETNNIRYLPKQLDHTSDRNQFFYQPKQVLWLKDLYTQKTQRSDLLLKIDERKDSVNLSDVGRACCGGRQVCLDKNLKHRHFYVGNKFFNWYCSVNEFFVHIKQRTGEIFVNKDCKMSFDNDVGPIGHLSDPKKLIEFTRSNLKNHTMPTIQCKKDRCFCGFCAPKSKSLEDFNNIMEKYHVK